MKDIKRANRHDLINFISIVGGMIYVLSLLVVATDVVYCLHI